MRDKSPAFQFYPKQILGDDKVLLMDWDARGMHHWLLWIAWQQEPPGTIPDDDAAIRRWLSSPSDDVWRRVKPQIMAAWPVQEGRRVNAGMVRAWERQQINKNNGHKKKQFAEEEEEDEEVDVSCSVFEKAYEVYPRHVGKRAAEKAWGQAINRETAKCVRTNAEHEDFLYQRVMTYAAACQRYHKPREFIPHMATWLNQDRFLDDPSEWEVTRQEQRNGRGTSKAEQRVADVAATTRAIFGNSGGLLGQPATDLPNAATSRGAGGLAGNSQGLLARGVTAGNGPSST